MEDGPTIPALPECDPEWRSRSLSALASHVSSVYHEHTRDELPALVRRVSELGGDSQPLRGLSAILSELRDEVETHAWTEDDLLFPALVAYDHPDVLATRLTADTLARLVASLVADHAHIRRVLGQLTVHVGAAIEQDGMPADWRELVRRLLALRDHLLEELDLEDRCLLPRVRLIIDFERTLIR